LCDVDRIGLGKYITAGYGGASERASGLITRENLLIPKSQQDAHVTEFIFF
jgi:hypothetical protein